MSLNLHPRWCPISIEIPIWCGFCPHCETNTELNRKQIELFLGDALIGSYYTIAHLPEKVIATCSNCENDYAVYFAACIRAVETKKEN